MAIPKRISPFVIFTLLATTILFFALFVTERAKHYDAHVTAEKSLTPQSEQVFEWRMVTSWPRFFPGLGSAPERFAKNVELMSGGRLKVKVHGGGEIVPPLGVFDAVSSGSVEMGHSGAYFWKGKIPTTALFTSIPFGMNAQEMNSWIHYGGGLELWQEIYAPYNLVPLAGGNTGVQMAGWFNKEINSVEDLKGLKMRIPGLGGEVLTRAGGTAVTLPGGELFTSLQTGVIDATEWVGPYNDLAFGFHKVAKYYYYPGWHEPGSMLEFVVNKQALEALPQDLQTIVKVAAREANQDMLDEYTARNNEALTRLVDEHGVEFRKLPDDVITTLQRISLDVVEEQLESDPVFAKVYKSFKVFHEVAKAYHKVSEEAMYRARRNALAK